MADESIKDQVQELLSILAAQQKSALAELHAVLTGEHGQAVLASIEAAKASTIPGSAYEKACQNMANALRATVTFAAQGAAIAS